LASAVRQRVVKECGEGLAREPRFARHGVRARQPADRRHEAGEANDRYMANATKKRIAAVGAALRSADPDAKANCTRFDASSTAACTGCRSSLAEIIGNRRTMLQVNAKRALIQREPGTCGELLRLLAKAQSAASARVIQIKLSSSSIFGSLGCELQFTPPTGGSA
jgi:hypothetical protein